MQTYRNLMRAGIIYGLYALYFLTVLTLPLGAMTFGTEPSPRNQQMKILVGRGPIEVGDAERFQVALAFAPPDVPVLMVTSPGGNVSAALRLAGQIKTHSFSIIGHKECASACAQILFPAGEYSILTHGSMLGIHSCSRSGERNDLCNERIAKFAVSNGFPYGTLDLFSDLYGPGEMKWMTEISARCFGFYRGTEDPKPIPTGRKPCVDGIMFTNVPRRPCGPSFDCSKASTQVEQLFCLDRELMQVDSILGRVYDQALKQADARERVRLRSQQRHWIKTRNSDCQTFFSASMDFRSTREPALCLYKYNEDRIYELIDNPFVK